MPRSLEQYMAMPANKSLTEAQAQDKYKNWERNRLAKVNLVQRHLYQMQFENTGGHGG